MPYINNQLVENLTPFEAEIRGYFSHEQYIVSQAWIDENLEVRHSSSLIYVNGVYRGVAKKNTPLYKIAEKFKLNDTQA